MMNTNERIEKAIEETKKRLEDARQRQIDAGVAAKWDETTDDYTALSHQLLSAYDAEEEAIKKQLEWLEYTNQKEKLRGKLPDQMIKKLDDAEDTELQAQDFLNTCNREERDELARGYIDAQAMRKYLIEKLEMMTE